MKVPYYIMQDGTVMFQMSENKWERVPLPGPERTEHYITRARHALLALLRESYPDYPIEEGVIEL